MTISGNISDCEPPAQGDDSAPGTDRTDVTAVSATKEPRVFRRRRDVDVFYVPVGEGVRVAFCRPDEAAVYAAALRAMGTDVGTLTVEPVTACVWCAWCGWRIGDCVGVDLLGGHDRTECRDLRYDVTVAAITTVSTLALLASERGDSVDIDDAVMQEAGEGWAVGLTATEVAFWVDRRRR
jgi:hypothetical protein